MIFTEEQDKILDRAVRLWGKYAQERMAVGECGEFIALQGRSAQNRDSNEDWISEIADVIIMMEQMAKLYGYEQVKEMVNFKMERLSGKIEKSIAKTLEGKKVRFKMPVAGVDIGHVRAIDGGDVYILVYIPQEQLDIEIHRLVTEIEYI